MLRSFKVGTIFGCLFLVMACVASLAQDSKSGSDEALDNLIEKLADPPSSDSKKDSGEDAGEAKPRKDSSGGGDESKSSGEGDSKSGSTGEVAPKDQELDSLLEKLGESKDEPEAEGPRKPQPGGDGKDDNGDRSKSQKPGPNQLGKKDQELDERLEELTGRKRKKKQSDQDDGGSGPVSEVVKQMREIEKRLGKPDTGEETQKKQKQIVKRLQTLIEQARQSGSSSSQMKIRQVRQAGQKPGGSKQGQEVGSNAGGAPLAKPEKPTNQRSLAGGKDIWGHLPPELRKEMENSFKEEALPDQIELIKRYYLSVSKNRLVREE